MSSLGVGAFGDIRTVRHRNLMSNGHLLGCTVATVTVEGIRVTPVLTRSPPLRVCGTTGCATSALLRLATVTDIVLHEKERAPLTLKLHEGMQIYRQCYDVYCY